METLMINGQCYAVEVHRGNSSLPYLLMLHGFMGDGRVFDHLIEGISHYCNPITVDLLGHGNSEKVYDPQRYGEYNQTQDLTDLVKELGYHSLLLYGYSMGGRLALKTALQKPDLFKGLILESTNNGIIDDRKRAARREADKKRAAEIEKNYENFLNRWEELDLFQSPTEKDEQLDKNYKSIQFSQDPKAMSASLIGFGTGSMEAVAKNFSDFENPVMIIAGSEDQRYIEISQSMAGYFDNVQLCHIPSGHRVHLDNPKELTQELTHFIDQNSLL